MTDLNQLLLQFNYNQNFNYDDFFVSKSNFFAFQLIKKWPRWEKNILNIHGEKFCGKTHLANIFYNKNKGIKIYENQINNEIFKKLKLYENIIIDDFKNETDEKLLYSLFNLVDSDNKFLLIKLYFSSRKFFSFSKLKKEKFLNCFFLFILIHFPISSI